MDKEIFEKEIAACKKLSKNNNGKCNWGECEKCGVIPLLYKLGRNEIYEEAREVDKLKQKLLAITNPRDKKRFKIIPTVYLILRRDDKILFARRCNTGFHDGDYSFPAGHVESGETMINAIIREAQEETGIIIKSDDLHLIHVMHRKEPNEERINLFFTADNWEGEPKIMEPDKCDDMQWFNINSFPTNTIPYIQKVIECVKNNVSYSEFGW